MTSKEKNETTTADPSVFTKQQLVNSKKYSTRQDALNALLVDGKTYSHTQVAAILERFDKGGK